MTDDAIGNSEQQVLADLGEAREQLSSERPLAGLGGVTVSPEAIRLLPVDFVKLHCLLPFGLRNGTIHIATAAPGNQRVIDDIRLLSGLEVEEFEAPASEILEKIGECYQVTVEKLIESRNRTAD